MPPINANHSGVVVYVGVPTPKKERAENPLFVMTVIGEQIAHYFDAQLARNDGLSCGEEHDDRPWLRLTALHQSSDRKIAQLMVQAVAGQVARQTEPQDSEKQNPRVRQIYIRASWLEMNYMQEELQRKFPTAEIIAVSVQG